MTMRRSPFSTGTITVLAFALTGVAFGKAAPYRPVTVDLRLIVHIASKGRIQDKTYNPNLPVVDALIDSGPAAIPFLLAKVEDETLIEPPVLDLWPRVRVGDVALLLLSDLFARSDGRSTVAGLSWDGILERRNPDASAWTLLDDFVAKHGRVGVRRRAEAILTPYHGRFAWEAHERCFKPLR